MHAWTACLVLATLGLPPRGAAAEGETPGPRLSTKEEYIACLAETDRIEAGDARLASREKAMKERAQKFQAADEALDAQARKHVPSTAKEIASYNRAIAQRNARADEFNREVRALQQDRLALNRLVVERNSRCGGLLVDSEVKEAAEAEYRRKPPE